MSAATFTDNTVGRHPATITGSWFESNGRAVEIAATQLTVKRTRFYRDTEGVTCRAATCTIDDNAFIEGGGHSLDILLATLGEPGPRGSDSISGRIVNGNHSGRAAIEVEGDGDGILLPGPIFEQNMIVDNDAGIKVLEASATLSANTFIRNGSAFSATTDANDPSEVSLYDNIVTLNTDGIQIDEASQLRGNLVTFNDGFGIRAAGSVDLVAPKPMATGRRRSVKASSAPDRGAVPVARPRRSGLLQPEPCRQRANQRHRQVREPGTRTRERCCWSAVPL